MDLRTGEKMNTIIIYDTKHGTTHNSAQKLKKFLDHESTIVDMRDKEKILLDDYDTVLIGSSIYMGKIRKSICKFCDSNLAALMGKKIGLFLCSTGADGEFEKNFPKVLLDNAVATENFGFTFDFEDANFLEKKIIEKVRKTIEKESGIKEDRIEAFAELFNSVD